MVVLSGNDIINKPVGCDTAVALGSFDAVHIGHTEIIKRVVEYARQNSLKALVYMFERSPKTIMQGDRTFVNTLEKRIEIMECLGVDFVVVEKFTEDYRKISYIDFVNRYIKEYLSAKFVCAGSNYKFGFNCEGTSKLLKEMCEDIGIEAYIQNCISFENIISTTYIKELVKNGETEKCAKYLGREFSLCGQVVHGREIGRKIGFPTANIEIPQDQIMPKHGVYITRAIIDGREYPSITNIGSKPTVGENSVNIETHIMDFAREIYEAEIELVFVKKIRDIVKFNGLDELKAQINKDRAAAIEYFENKS